MDKLVEKIRDFWLSTTQKWNRRAKSKKKKNWPLVEKGRRIKMEIIKEYVGRMRKSGQHTNNWPSNFKVG